MVIRMLNPYFLVGQILKPQGVHGEAKVKPYAANPDDFKRWKTLYLKDGENYRAAAARCSRVHDGFAYVTLEGCSTPEDVERLRGRELYVDREHAAPLGEDEVYISDLIGCEAVTREGETVGTLIDVLQYGMVDTYVFRTKKGSLMAPALKKVFVETDVENRKIIVDRERLEEVAVLED